MLPKLQSTRRARSCPGALLLLFGAPPARANQAIASRTVQDLEAGSKNSPLVLLHGYTETSRMWKPIMAVRVR